MSNVKNQAKTLESGMRIEMQIGRVFALKKRLSI